MSSKLIRGEGIAAEPVAWRHVSSTEFIAGASNPRDSGNAADPPLSYISEPGSPPEPKKAPDIEQLVSAAHNKGFEEGQAAGRQSMAPQMEALQMKLARTIEELTGLRPRYRRQAEQDMVALALAVARRILHRELTMAPEALLGLVKAALDKMEAREVHKVRVSRSDAALVRQFFEQNGSPDRVEVVADANLAPGSVLIESNHGLLDASVDTQLAEIERGFADLVRSSA
jgi:flagellar assembly protein FliH